MRINSGSPSIDQSSSQSTQPAVQQAKTAQVDSQIHSSGKVEQSSVSSARKAESGFGANLVANQIRSAIKPSVQSTVNNAVSTAARRPASTPTTLQVTGTAAFRSQVAKDLATFAPGTTVDAKGFVHAATKLTAGHDQGYALVNNLLNGKKLVTIGFISENASTGSGAGAQVLPGGIPGRGTANTGSAANVVYDPAWSKTIALPTLQKDGTVKDQVVDSSVVLAHELIHATHAQRGTIDRSLVDHTFTAGGQTFKENWRFEEFRTTGLTGRQGNEPTENSIRAELGFQPRATYLFSDSWQPVNSVAKNSSSISASKASNEAALNFVKDND